MSFPEDCKSFIVFKNLTFVRSGALIVVAVDPKGATGYKLFANGVKGVVLLIVTHG